MPDSPLIVASLPMLGTAVSRRRLLQGTGVTALAALLSACGDGSSTSGDGSGGGDATSQEIDTADGRLPRSMSNIYPGKEAGIFNYYVAVLVGEGLVAPDSTGKLHRALAESWKQTSPPRTCTRCAATSPSATARRSPPTTSSTRSTGARQKRCRRTPRTTGPTPRRREDRRQRGHHHADVARRRVRVGSVRRQRDVGDRRAVRQRRRRRARHSGRALLRHRPLQGHQLRARHERRARARRHLLGRQGPGEDREDRVHPRRDHPTARP